MTKVTKLEKSHKVNLLLNQKLLKNNLLQNLKLLKKNKVLNKTLTNSNNNNKWIKLQTHNLIWLNVKMQKCNNKKN